MNLSSHTEHVIFVFTANNYYSLSSLIVLLILLLLKLKSSFSGFSAYFCFILAQIRNVARSQRRKLNIMESDSESALNKNTILKIEY